MIQISDIQTIRYTMTANCPYDPKHIMPVDSLLRHLSRCSATNKHEFSQCKYNQLHVIRKEFINHHYANCPDSKRNWNDHDDDDWSVYEKTAKVEDFQDMRNHGNQAYFIEQVKRGQGRPTKNAAPPQQFSQYKNQDWEEEEPKKKEIFECDQQQIQRKAKPTTSNNKKKLTSDIIKNERKSQSPRKQDIKVKVEDKGKNKGNLQDWENEDDETPKKPIFKETKSNKKQDYLGQPFDCDQSFIQDIKKINNKLTSKSSAKVEDF